jgi:hypothetical protein
MPLSAGPRTGVTGHGPQAARLVRHEAYGWPGGPVDMVVQQREIRGCALSGGRTPAAEK